MTQVGRRHQMEFEMEQILLRHPILGIGTFLPLTPHMEDSVIMVEVDAVIAPAEPDVGLLDPYLDDWVIKINGTEIDANLLDSLGTREESLEDYALNRFMEDQQNTFGEDVGDE